MVSTAWSYNIERYLIGEYRIVAAFFFMDGTECKNRMELLAPLALRTATVFSRGMCMCCSELVSGHFFFFFFFFAVVRVFFCLF